MSDKKITSIKKNKTSALDWTVIETLKQLIEDIESGECNDYNACYISLMDTRDSDHYKRGFRMSGMRFTGAISLLEIQKQDMVLTMLASEEPE